MDIIYDKIPKSYVNLVTPVDVTRLGVLSSGLCSLLHPYECGCAVGSKSDIEYTTVMFENYTTACERIGKLAKYQQKADFALFVQPFFKDTVVPYKDGKPDSSYFAPDWYGLL